MRARMRMKPGVLLVVVTVAMLAVCVAAATA
jgi:hypothetical protein